MIIKVRVKPNALNESIEKMQDGSYKISLKEKALEGRANKALVKMLCKEFNVRAKDVKVKGLHSRDKIVEIKE